MQNDAIRVKERAVRALTVRLESTDYARLEGEAERLGLSPGTLARVYVRAGLNGGAAETERRRRAGLAALDRLNALTAGLPPVDAVKVAAASRTELDRRHGLP
jgi:hypothetical protein